jgi:hypothetical protein
LSAAVIVSVERVIIVAGALAPAAAAIRYISVRLAITNWPELR